MEALVAGFIAGHAMGIAVTAIYGPLALQLAPSLWLLRERFPAGTPLPMLSLGVALVVQAAWGAAGLLLGAVYWSVRGQALNGLGSPAWGFTLAMLLFAGGGVALLAMIQPGWARRAGLAALCYAGLFGWLLPYLGDG